MSRPEARTKAAERRRTRIKEAGGRIVQIALRAEGAQALADLQRRTGKGPSTLIEELLIRACAQRKK